MSDYMFPDYLDGAKVLFYTDPGHFGFITDYDDANVPIEKEIFYEAVCQYTGQNEFYLFSCDEVFNVIGDICFDPIEICNMCRLDSENTPWHKKTTPYLYTAAQRKALGGTTYFEFQRGRFRHKFWLDHSVYLHIDLFDQLDLHKIFLEAIPDFDYYGVTEVTPGQYDKLKTLASDHGGDAAALFEELDGWVKNCYQVENVFSILGI